MGIWSQASALAANTPQERNRYVDFLRAVSILVVIVGHWLIATGHYVDGTMTPGHLLKSHPQVQWLTWLFQVMPIFFIVGGYSNAVSLESADRKGVGYGGWLAGRLNRLVTPLLALIVFWGITAFIMEVAGVRPAVITYVSQASLIPTWFLAIYIMLVILAPPAYRLWKRFGVASFWGFVALAVLTDIAFFGLDWRFLGWGNYFWVWLAVHQLGFAWRDGKIRGPAIMLVYSATGIAILYLAITLGPYPLAMVGSPDEGLSNTLPPKATLLALALFQFGLLMAIEEPMRKALAGLRLWTATVLINSMIMTVYLWHITVMILLGVVLWYFDGFGFRIEPGSTLWWQTRPVWIAVLMLLLVPTALLLSAFERVAPRDPASAPPAARQIIGAIMICLGITILTLYGFSNDAVPNLDWAALGLVVVGAGINGLLPRLRTAKAR
ncbi:MAG: acyltransferase [Woeseiaceae bacterium]|nr:acyltransferase [Woeseiaceae bacterium]